MLKFLISVAMALAFTMPVQSDEYHTKPIYQVDVTMSSVDPGAVAFDTQLMRKFEIDNTMTSGPTMFAATCHSVADAGVIGVSGGGSIGFGKTNQLT